MKEALLKVIEWVLVAVCEAFASSLSMLNWIGNLVGQLVSALTSIGLFCGAIVGVYFVLDRCHLPALSIIVLGLAGTAVCFLTLGFWKPHRLDQLL